MTTELARIVPPATIGMLGGGQLGKYALMAANAMGYRTIVLDPDPNAPAGVVANRHLVAAFDDADALDVLAQECAVVTTEFENPPAESLQRLERDTRVAPSSHCVAIAQDRIVEKAFMVDNGIAVGPHVAVRAGDTAALERARELAANGAVVKTARMGYDGKGQVRVQSAEQLDDALVELGGVDCIVESLLDLEREVSVLIARDSAGGRVTWRLADNLHVNGVLDVSSVPSSIDAALEHDARTIAQTIAEAMDYVGVLAVELFVVAGASGELEVLVNEIAPRPHNSGHWTIDVSATSQFEQQIRAVCGVGLGDTDMTAPGAAMVNLLGDVWFAALEVDDSGPDWASLLTHPRASLHLYGKAEARPGRKMGHVTVAADSADEAAARALHARSDAQRDRHRA